MDKITHKVRCEQWTNIIKECLASGMPKTTWCREHGISDKSFFYWQRILREEAYLTTLESTLAPAVKENSAPTTTDFIEIKMTDQVSSEERLTQRQLVIKPLVDVLFAYLKKMEPTVPASGQLRKAYTYILNQEKYLRVFLEDGEVPIDNNASERAIRGFCIGKKNWQMIDTINGAHSSAIIYSIAETAKANSLKPYDYFVYLLEEIPKHMDQEDRTFLEDLLPWSEKLPEEIRKQP